jgi:alginate O-acetyltransferase complex protein AlgI
LTLVIEYAATFLICLAIFARVRSRPVRQATLLTASYVLYLSWGLWFGAVLITSTIINFLIGRSVRRNQTVTTLFLGIAFNLALLSTFKYLPEASVHLSFSSLQPLAHLALPLGISFWTFQAMSYLFDLYQGEELDPTFSEFALYMVFFPVTISGPVCRMPDMLLQFRSEEPLRGSGVTRGFRRIAIGVLMMQVAKLLGQGILAGDSINSGFDRVTQWSGPDVWCLAFGYGLQLFFDFAGYSHIAIGAALALGFTIPENFARPFTSSSPSVFWTRWHMSLSFWIRDYIFFPLMQMRREMWWRSLSLVIAMTAFGLWHKATFLFLIWGCYHGVLLVAHRQIEALQRKYDWNPPERWWNAISWISTVLLVNLGWIFFRANDLPQAHEMLKAVLSFSTYKLHFLSISLYALVLAVAVGYAIVVFVSDVVEWDSTEREDGSAGPSQAKAPFTQTLFRWRWFWVTPIYFIALVVLLIVTLSQGTSTAQLMYGNF